tara:strand:- start:256 stop:465 length:210 start_codon:yes stop_codon:yes gene_type:complete
LRRILRYFVAGVGGADVAAKSAMSMKRADSLFLHLVLDTFLLPRLDYYYYLYLNYYLFRSFEDCYDVAH